MCDNFDIFKPMNRNTIFCLTIEQYLTWFSCYAVGNGDLELLVLVLAISTSNAGWSLFSLMFCLLYCRKREHWMTRRVIVQ